MKKLILGLLILILVPNPSFASISFVTGLARQHGNLTLNTSSLSCSGADFLVVSVLENEIGTNSNIVTGVTYGGVSMVKVADGINENNPDVNVQLYVLHAPASGTNNIVISQIHNTSVLYSAGCYSGVNQSDTVDASNSAQVNGSGDQTVSITTINDNDWLIMSFVTDVVESDGLINAVVRNEDPLELDYSISDSNGEKSPAGNYTIGYHAPSADRGLIVAIALAPAPLDTTPPSVTVPSDIATQATSTSRVSVSFSATASDDVDGVVIPACLPSSGSLFAIGTTTVACGAIDTAGNAATSTFKIIVSKLTPVLAWDTPADITYGAALSGVQLNATTTDNVLGSYAYTPALGTVLNASSTQILHVDFTPDDASSYASTSTDVRIAVAKANLDVAADDKTITQGDPEPIFTLHYSGFVHGDDASALAASSTASVIGSHTDPGTYPITPTGGSASNYNLLYHNGTLTVMAPVVQVAASVHSNSNGAPVVSIAPATSIPPVISVVIPVSPKTVPIEKSPQISKAIAVSVVSATAPSNITQKVPVLVSRPALSANAVSAPASKSLLQKSASALKSIFLFLFGSFLNR